MVLSVFSFQKRLTVFRVGKTPVVDYNRDHAFPLPVDPDHQVADQAGMGFFPVGLNPEAAHPGQEGFRDFSGRRHGVGAGRCRNHRVGAGRVKAQHRFLRRAAAGQGGLVPVGSRMLHAQHGRNLNGYFPDPLKAVPDLQALSFQGGFIAHMAAGTAAAAGINRADGIPAVRGGNGGQSFHPSESIPFFRLDDPDVRFFPRKQSGHKNRHAVQAADAFHLCAEFFRRQAEDLIFLHGKPPFLREILHLFYQRGRQKSTKCRVRKPGEDPTYGKTPGGLKKHERSALFSQKKPPKKA